MHDQVDDKVKENILMSKIIEYKIDDSAIKKEGGFVIRGSNKHRCNTTKGCQLLVTCKYWISTW